MPRGPRLDAPGVLHHVMARGIERQLLFRNDADRDDFVRRLAALAETEAWSVYAWALMPNHFHLLVRTATVPLAKALIAANPDRVVWGTDWPHPSGVTPPGRKPTDVTPLLQIDDGRLLNQLAVWAPDPAIRKKILVNNPARLYAF
jgi:predicted TIM-barrel fold metal-dependent hydrolase